MIDGWPNFGCCQDRGSWDQKFSVSNVGSFSNLQGRSCLDKFLSIQKQWVLDFCYQSERHTRPPIMVAGKPIARNSTPNFFIREACSLAVSTWSLTSSTLFAVSLMLGFVSGRVFTISLCGSGNAPNTIAPISDTTIASTAPRITFSDMLLGAIVTPLLILIRFKAVLTR